MILQNGGEIGLEKKRHFALYDTEQKFAAADKGYAKLLELGGGMIIYKTAGEKIVDYAKAFNVPSLWMNDGAGKIGGAACGSDFGMVLSAAAFNGSRKVIQSNGFFKSNEYAAIELSDEPSLLVQFNQSGVDTTSSYNPVVAETILSDGVIITLTTIFGGIYALFLNVGAVYLFHSVSGYAAPFGWLPERSVSFSLLDSLEPLRLYCIQSVPNIAQGTVWDAAGKPAAGCRVLAYQRSSGKPVGQTVSAADGSYRCPVIAAKGDEIFMVCLDNDAAPDFEARIIDRITV